MTTEQDANRPWVVLKYGGTSVATADGWRAIAARVRALRPTRRVWVVASALGGVTDRLGRAIEAAAGGDLGWRAEVDAIRAQHTALAETIGAAPGGPELGPVEALLAELGRLLEGVALTREAPPRLRARIFSAGELMSTWLGVALLEAQGITAARVDARDVLATSDVPDAPSEQRYLEADVPAGGDRARVEALLDPPDTAVVLTQGFIARTAAGETALLGRGGSDTSAALMAVCLDAAALEIWTDVPGLFTADPRRLPDARHIRRVGYREAQELAAMGAKVLHPRCLPPVARAGIPVRVESTLHPELQGTRIEPDADRGGPAVTAVTARAGRTLVTVSTLEMWAASGFLARVFAEFGALGLSVDLVGTSQSAVSLTLDEVPGGVSGPTFQSLLERLRPLGAVEVVHPCAVVSIVGRAIRSVLPRLGPALQAFEERPVHLVSDSSEDLNLSFVVDEADAPALVSRIHGRLFPAADEPLTEDARLGETWGRLTAPADGRHSRAALPPAWWSDSRAALLPLVSDGAPRFVYHLPTVDARAAALRAELTAVEGFFYATKANDHPEILRAIADRGFGIECVSVGEVRHARATLGDAVPLLFTPNFCPVDEYAAAFDAGADVTVDGGHVFEQAPAVFEGRAVAVRIDPGEGLGHHEKVRTAGARSKFGVPPDELPAVLDAARALGARVVGLHAHVGSGVFDAEAWARTGRALFALREQCPDLAWLDVGGGLGVVERPGQAPLDLAAMNAGLESLRAAMPDVALRIEPGRYLVSEAGVLLAPVTQVRTRAGSRFVGLSTGMNSLLRPALYGAWHGIYNLSRLDEPVTQTAHVVGPICESSDVLGRARPLPETAPGDVLLVANAGAYGRVMSSTYNRRPPAAEVILR